jgi:crotonobetainyl-CoA:carnitine CoA-transferase CaiB-like acyl-CoA transferase
VHVAEPSLVEVEGPSPEGAPEGEEHPPGNHTDQVLEELGLDMDAILDLKLKGAVL